MSPREFVDTVTGDLLGGRVFVFTPKGEIKDLPKGPTIIDYAYQIHLEVGNKMISAKVNLLMEILCPHFIHSQMLKCWR